MDTSSRSGGPRYALGVASITRSPTEPKRLLKILQRDGDKIVDKFLQQGIPVPVTLLRNSLASFHLQGVPSVTISSRASTLRGDSRIPGALLHLAPQLGHQRTPCEIPCHVHSTPGQLGSRYPRQLPRASPNSLGACANPYEDWSQRGKGLGPKIRIIPGGRESPGARRISPNFVSACTATRAADAAGEALSLSLWRGAAEEEGEFCSDHRLGGRRSRPGAESTRNRPSLLPVPVLPATPPPSTLRPAASAAATDAKGASVVAAAAAAATQTATSARSRCWCATMPQ